MQKQHLSLWNYRCICQFPVSNGSSAAAGDTACIFLDDIQIATKRKEEFSRVLKEVLDRLEQYEIALKCSKCKFFQLELKCFGEEIESEGYTLQHKKWILFLMHIFQQISRSLKCQSHSWEC